MDAIEVEGSESIEVIAQFDGAIVDVMHLLRDDGDERTARWLVGAGLAALSVAGVAFACAWAGVPLGRAVDVVVALALVGGTGALMRGLDRRAERPPRDYSIGADAHARVAVAPGAVPLPCFPLVRVDEAGDFELTFTERMTGSLTVDGATQPLEANGRASVLVGGARAHRLGAGARAWVKVGGATFHVANVPAPRRQPRAGAIDWARQVYLGSITLVVSAFLFLVYAIPPEPRALAVDLVHGDHFARFVVMPPELPPPPPGRAAASGSPGSAAPGAKGALGKPTATHRSGQIRLPGPVSRDKLLAAARAAAQDAGILGVMRASIEGGQVGSIFGPGHPLGDGAPEILLGLEATELRDGYGSGLDSVGAGPGGDGDSPRTIGVGKLPTIGFCETCKLGDRSYARSAPTRELIHHAQAPEVHPGLVSVRCGANASCLDKEIVRRIIRQHRNEVRFCYERALAAKPELGGRVVTQFTIAANGRVLGSAVSESSVGNREVEQCIAEAVRRWEFPASQQMAIVSYPFILTPPR